VSDDRNIAIDNVYAEVTGDMSHFGVSIAEAAVGEAPGIVFGVSIVVYGSARKPSMLSLWHDDYINAKRDELLQDSEVAAIYIERPLRQINPAIDSNIQPDLTVQYTDGTYQFWEVQSFTDKYDTLQKQVLGYEAMFQDAGFQIRPGGVIPKPKP
jgi:hypothetical protein